MEGHTGLPTLDMGIVNYIGNHMISFRSWNSAKVPTLDEANAYQACLGAMKDHANVVALSYKLALKTMEGEDAEGTE